MEAITGGKAGRWGLGGPAGKEGSMGKPWPAPLKRMRSSTQKTAVLRDILLRFRQHRRDLGLYIPSLTLNHPDLEQTRLSFLITDRTGKTGSSLEIQREWG